MNSGLWLVIGFVCSFIIAVRYIYNVNEQPVSNAIYCIAALIFGTMAGPITALLLLVILVQSFHKRWIIHQNEKRYYGTKHDKV